MLHSENTRSNSLVLGTLAKFPQLFLNPKMLITEEDFQHPLHKVAFTAMKNLFCINSKIKKITPECIDNYLSAYSESYEIWNKHDGYNFMHKVIEHPASEMFAYHYAQVLNYSRLRFFAENGVDATKLFDYNETDLNKLNRTREAFQFLGTDEVKKRLIELGKGDQKLLQSYETKENEIDNQIALLMRQKQEVAEMRELLK